MNKEAYEKTISFFYHNKTAYNLLKITYTFLPLVMFIAYPVLLIYKVFTAGFGHELLRLTLVPLGVLVLVTILRRLINAERPYERYGTQSVFSKQTKGQSMPSRHTASSFIIAMAFMYISMPLGIIGLVMVLLIALSRIFAGVHFIRDVIAGAVISAAAGIVFFFII